MKKKFLRLLISVVIFAVVNVGQGIMTPTYGTDKIEESDRAYYVAIQKYSLPPEAIEQFRKLSKKKADKLVQSLDQLRQAEFERDDAEDKGYHFPTVYKRIRRLHKQISNYTGLEHGAWGAYDMHLSEPQVPYDHRFCGILLEPEYDDSDVSERCSICEAI